MALLFNSSANSFVESNCPTVSLPITMACWFKPINATATHVLMSLGVAGASDQGQYRISCHGALAGDPIRGVCVNSAGTSQFAGTSAGFTANTWQHACAVFTSTSSRSIFRNGTSKGTSVTTITVNTPTKVNFGVNQLTTGVYSTFCDAAIAEACIWNVALSDAEVALIAKKGYNPLHMKRSEIVAYWPITGRIDPDPDLIGGNNLSWFNSPTYEEHISNIRHLAR